MMILQQRPGEKDAKGVFTTLNERPILWTDANGITHRCEGADVHPGTRLLWTKCERDVPAGKAFLPGDAPTPVDCPACLAKIEAAALDPDPSRQGVFRDHNCWRCDSGKKPCINGEPRRCDTLHARND